MLNQPDGMILFTWNKKVLTLYNFLDYSKNGSEEYQMKF